LDVNGAVTAKSANIAGALNSQTANVNGKIKAKEVEVTLAGWFIYCIGICFFWSLCAILEPYRKHLKYFYEFCIFCFLYEIILFLMPAIT